MAGNNPKSPATFQAELTDNCDQKTQWCSDEDFSCREKVDNGEFCDFNNYTCKSNICHPFFQKCVACVLDSQCADGLICTDDGHCEIKKKDAGEKCMLDSECIEDHWCTNGRC